MVSLLGHSMVSLLGHSMVSLLGILASCPQRFGHLGLQFAKGGQISIDCFPKGANVSPFHKPSKSIFLVPSPSSIPSCARSPPCCPGWDKTFCLQYVEGRGHQVLRTALTVAHYTWLKIPM